MQIFEKLKPLALLLLRVGVGGIFLWEGYLKLFVSPAKWLVWFPQHGFPSYFAYLAGGMEFFGGILLILGLVTRIAGLLLAVEMGVAVWKGNLPNSGAIHAEPQPKHESPADKSVELITSQFPYFDKVTARDALMRIRQHSRR